MSGSFVFVLDDHESMGSGGGSPEKMSEGLQTSSPCHDGAKFSHIDIARSGVDSFLAFYAKQQMHAALMLLRPANDKSCIRSYIGDPVDVFEREIKNITINPTSTTTINNTYSSSTNTTESKKKSKMKKNSITTAVSENDDDTGTSSAVAADDSAGDTVGTNDKSTSESKNTNFSYSLSTALSILNKHRLRNRTVDAFGYGRFPYLLEPGNIFIFTNINGQNGHKFELENKLGVVNDYVTGPCKWDHRVWLFVISTPDDSAEAEYHSSDGSTTGQQQSVHNSSGGSSSSSTNNDRLEINSDLVNLCRNTGGDIFLVSSMAEAKASMIRLMSNLCMSPNATGSSNSGSSTCVGKSSLSCNVNFVKEHSVFDDEEAFSPYETYQDTDSDTLNLKKNSQNKVCLARIGVLKYAEWPIPEDIPIDVTQDSMPARSQLPKLCIKDAKVVNNNGGNTNNGHASGTTSNQGKLLSISECMQFIREYDIPHGIYGVSGKIHTELNLSCCDSVLPYNNNHKLDDQQQQQQQLYSVSMAKLTDSEYKAATLCMQRGVTTADSGLSTLHGGNSPTSKTSNDSSLSYYYDASFGILVSTGKGSSNTIANNSANGITTLTQHFTSAGDVAQDEHDMLHLYILPFDYQKYFTLLLQGKDLLHKQKMISKSSTTSGGNGTRLVMTTEYNKCLSLWKNELNTYFNRIPGYYVQPTITLLSSLGLSTIASLKIPIEYNIPLRANNRLNKAIDSAGNDIKDMELLSSNKWHYHRRQATPIAVALSNTATSHQILPVGPFNDSIPKHITTFVNDTNSLNSIATIQDLANTWEKMRTVVYGGGHGTFVRGLSITGIPGSGSYVSAAASSSAVSLSKTKNTTNTFASADTHHNSNKTHVTWIEDACGASPSASLNIKDMSNYQHVLASHECLRDVDNITDTDASTIRHHEEEDRLDNANASSNILKRKLFNVNFGNRYSKGSRSSSSSSSSSNSSGGSKVTTANSGNTTHGTSGNVVGSPTNNSQTHELFGDTPRPNRSDNGDNSSDYEHTFMLEEAILLPNVMNTNNSPHTPPGTPPSLSSYKNVNMQEYGSSESSSSSNSFNNNENIADTSFVQVSGHNHYKSIDDLPLLGKPPRRGKKRSYNHIGTSKYNSSQHVSTATNTNNILTTGTSPAIAVAPVGVSPSTEYMQGEEEIYRGGASLVEGAVTSVTNQSLLSTGDNNVSNLAATATAIPSSCWEVVYSNTHKRNYWFNRTTGKSSWENPHT